MKRTLAIILGAIIFFGGITIVSAQNQSVSKTQIVELATKLLRLYEPEKLASDTKIVSNGPEDCNATRCSKIATLYPGEYLYKSNYGNPLSIKLSKNYITELEKYGHIIFQVELEDLCYYGDMVENCGSTIYDMEVKYGQINWVEGTNFYIFIEDNRHLLSLGNKIKPLSVELIYRRTCSSFNYMTDTPSPDCFQKIEL